MTLLENATRPPQGVGYATARNLNDRWRMLVHLRQENIFIFQNTFIRSNVFSILVNKILK